MLNFDNLYGYQIKAIKTVLNIKKVGLFMDMGLGKTIVCLTSIVILLKRRTINKVLIIAPKSVVNGVWKQEAANWEHTKDLKISLVTGDAKKRIEALNTEADIYCISRDNTAWVSALKDAENGFLKQCNMLVIDESSSFKHRSGRWKALCLKGKRKRTLISQFERVVLLSGTPAENYENLWTQIYLLDGGDRLFKNITAFRQCYMLPDIIKNRIIYRFFKPGATEIIDRKIKDICFSMSSEDFLQLPEKVEVIRYTGYTPDKSYKEMRYNGVLHIDKETTVLAVEPATRYGKLREIASGGIYTESGKCVSLHRFKVEALKDVLEELGNKNVLVFYQFNFEKEILLKEFNGETIETPEQQKRWNNGLIKIAIANPSSVGYGLNIQYGGNIIIFYSLPLSYESYIQAVKRIHRQGNTEKTVTVIHLIGQYTIEEEVYKLLKERKADILNQLMMTHKLEV